VGRDKLIAARAGWSVPAPTMAPAIDGTPAARLFAASPTEVAGDTAAELATGTDRMLLRLDNVGKSFGGNLAVTDVSLTPSEGQFSGQSAGWICIVVLSLMAPARRAFSQAGIREWNPGAGSAKAEFATLVVVGRSVSGTVGALGECRSGHFLSGDSRSLLAAGLRLIAGLGYADIAWASRAAARCRASKSAAA